MIDSAIEGPPRTYTIRKSPYLGFGFIAGDDFPTIVKAVERSGPSSKLLQVGDIIMDVNGRDVRDMDRRQIIDFIQNCQDEIRITVRQPSYEESIRAKGLSDPRFYTLNSQAHISKSKPVACMPLNDNHQFGNRAPPVYPSVYARPSSPLNRLVTSISQQHPPADLYPQLPPKTPSHNHLSKIINVDGDTPPVQIRGAGLHLNSTGTLNGNFKSTSNILKQVPMNGSKSNLMVENFFKSSKPTATSTLGRNHNGYGRHSPLPQRCKSSATSNNDRQNGKQENVNADKHLLKRSNTLRPTKVSSQTKPIKTKPPAEVLEIFEVVIKIFFEVGHTRVLNYNQDTTVGTILETLNARLTSNSPYSDHIKKYFGLALTVGQSSETGQAEQPKRKLLHILDENDSIMKIRQLPYAPRLRLVYRMVYPPADVCTLYSQDKVAFEYLYQQSCNDLKLERFSPELDQDTALKLSALHLVEYVFSNHSKEHGSSRDAKVYMKLVKKTPGIEFFVPASMADADKDGKKYKKLRSRLTEQLKKNFEDFDFEPPKVKSTTNLNCYSSTSFHELSLPELQSSPSDYVKLLFLNYLSQLPCYGNSKRPNRDGSPLERSSVGDCSSSLESVPRTSDSSPLIRQQKANHNSHNGATIMNDRMGNAPNLNTISRLAQVNSMRSLSSAQTPTSSQHIDRPDIALTPSIESISSITFNMQSSPSPQQQIHPYVVQHHQHNHHSDFSTMAMNNGNMAGDIQPSPMPRQNHAARNLDFDSSIEKSYSQRYRHVESSIDELLKNVVLPPPPPPPPPMTILSDMFDQAARLKMELRQANRQLTQVLTDQDIERLLVPPPPRIFF